MVVKSVGYIEQNGTVSLSIGNFELLTDIITICIYLADCLTWRKLENTGYHPYLLTILRARIVGNVHVFAGITLTSANLPIGTQICQSLSAMTHEDKHVRQIPLR